MLGFLLPNTWWSLGIAMCAALGITFLMVEKW